MFVLIKFITFQGFKTLDDLREKADLNFQQQIGLKFYDEFLERMPRSEVEEIENSVSSLCCSVVYRDQKNSVFDRQKASNKLFDF